jgi:hypothetical protein
MLKGVETEARAWGSIGLSPIYLAFTRPKEKWHLPLQADEGK